MKAWGIAACTATLGLSQLTLATPASAQAITSRGTEDAKAACEALIKLTPKDTRLTLAALISDGTKVRDIAYPEHCRVTGIIEERVGVNNVKYGTMFELRLPSKWNERYFFQGQGGTGGSVQDAVGLPSPPSEQTALTKGYASVTFDGGHQGGDPTFGLDPKARDDFAFHSMDVAAIVTKELVRDYYKAAPRYSYFSGCSNGGRQGMKFSQAFPHHFDGILAGSATYRLAVSYAATSNEIQQLTAIAPKNADGDPILANALSDGDIKLLSNDILAVCDGKDGVVDGMVSNTNACQFADYDPGRLQCTGAKTDSCLSGDQVRALRNIYGVLRNSKGEALYSPLAWDPAIVDPQWRNWKLGKSQTKATDAIRARFANTSIGYLYLTPPDPDFNAMKFDLDVHPAKLATVAPTMDAASPDLKAFRARGGKILWWHGMMDPSTPANDVIRYYEEMTKATTGSFEESQKFARIFLAPGVGHCDGGQGLERFDAFGALVDWVENGKAPERILATGKTFPGRTRPLCNWPAYAHYNGSGDINDAANFTCR